MSCILRHRGVQLILAYSWARPAILVADKGRGGMFLLSPAFSKKSGGTLFLVFRGAWFQIFSRYFVPLTPPTVFQFLSDPFETLQVF